MGTTADAAMVSWSPERKLRQAGHEQVEWDDAVVNVSKVESGVWPRWLARGLARDNADVVSRIRVGASIAQRRDPPESSRSSLVPLLRIDSCRPTGAMSERIR